ncbi:MAG TPA: RpiB/LacA/LacB family sugar-phosphate isomerase, partial [Armatimonadetes bacterium]|nr:RpiB/LacA/LacB family sugar-phosphate isomerase [Armatimonadota bacterium]
MEPASLRVAIASDHAGFELKRRLVERLRERGFSVEDLGPLTPDPVDYPDFVAKVAEAVSKGEFERGIVICGTGVGSSIVANKFPGVYCALCHDT